MTAASGSTPSIEARIQSICTNLGIQYDTLVGTTPQAKIMNLTSRIFEGNGSQTPSQLQGTITELTAVATSAGLQPHVVEQLSRQVAASLAGRASSAAAPAAGASVTPVPTPVIPAAAAASVAVSAPSGASDVSGSRTAHVNSINLEPVFDWPPAVAAFYDR